MDKPKWRVLAGSLLGSDPLFLPYDVYVYEYASRFVGTGFSIDEIAENMQLTLDTDLVSDHKEIIFVSHSMGGLVTRAYLNKNRAAADHVRLAYFYSTPTTGSELASIASLVSRNPQLAQMRPMQSAEYLADLQRQWLDINFQIPSFCAYEKQSTYGVNVVTQASASNLCNRRLDPIDADHMTIVKPADARDTPYRALKSAIQQTPSKVSTESTTGIIRPVDAFLSHSQAVKAQGFIGDKDTQTHTVFIRVNFRFLENRFNNTAYFASFDDVTVKWISKSGGSDDRARANFFSSAIETSPEKLTTIVALEFARRPEAGDRLRLSIGPVSYEHVVSDESFKWETTVFDPDYYNVGRAPPWTVAFAEVQYEHQRPDWLTITDAQLLNGRDGISLLRATVSNPTDETRPLLAMRFTASQPRIRNDINCAQGDLPQTVVLRWEKEQSGEKLAADTSLDGVEIPVRIEYTFEGICSGYYMGAHIPLSESIPANSTRLISLRLKELPHVTNFEISGGPGLFHFLIPKFPFIGDILTWPDKSISFSTDRSSIIKPKVFALGSPTKVGTEAK